MASMQRSPLLKKREMSIENKTEELQKKVEVLTNIQVQLMKRWVALDDEKKNLEQQLSQKSPSVQNINDKERINNQLEDESRNKKSKKNKKKRKKKGKQSQDDKLDNVSNRKNTDTTDKSDTEVIANQLETSSAISSYQISNETVFNAPPKNFDDELSAHKKTDSNNEESKEWKITDNPYKMFTSKDFCVQRKLKDLFEKLSNSFEDEEWMNL